MKSIIILMGLCITGMVSAITTSWTPVKEETQISDNTARWIWESNTANNGCSYNGNADFAIRVTFTNVTLLETQKDWRVLLGVKNGLDKYSFQNLQKGLWVPHGATLKPDFFTWEGTKNFSVTLAYDNTLHTLKFYLGNENIYTISDVTIGAWVTFSVGSEGGEDHLLKFLFSSGTYKVEYTDDIGLVPEPTVLALLAMSIAGLALRRKTI